MEFMHVLRQRPVRCNALLISLQQALNMSHDALTNRAQLKKNPQNNSINSVWFFGCRHEPRVFYSQESTLKQTASD
jgi:hypothetical protein